MSHNSVAIFEGGILQLCRNSMLHDVIGAFPSIQSSFKCLQVSYLKLLFISILSAFTSDGINNFSDQHQLSKQILLEVLRSMCKSTLHWKYTSTKQHNTRTFWKSKRRFRDLACNCCFPKLLCRAFLLSHSISVWQTYLRLLFLVFKQDRIAHLPAL